MISKGKSKVLNIDGVRFDVHTYSIKQLYSKWSVDGVFTARAMYCQGKLEIWEG